MSRIRVSRRLCIPFSSPTFQGGRGEGGAQPQGGRKRGVVDGGGGVVRRASRSIQASAACVGGLAKLAKVGCLGPLGPIYFFKLKKVRWRRTSGATQEEGAYGEGFVEGEGSGGILKKRWREEGGRGAWRRESLFYFMSMYILF